jgi:hypothetical protein
MVVFPMTALMIQPSTRDTTTSTCEVMVCTIGCMIWVCENAEPRPNTAVQPVIESHLHIRPPLPHYHIFVQPPFASLCIQHILMCFYDLTANQAIGFLPHPHSHSHSTHQHMTPLCTAQQCNTNERCHKNQCARPQHRQATPHCRPMRQRTQHDTHNAIAAVCADMFQTKINQDVVRVAREVPLDKGKWQYSSLPVHQTH